MMIRPSVHLLGTACFDPRPWFLPLFCAGVAHVGRESCTHSTCSPSGRFWVVE